MQLHIGNKSYKINLGGQVYQIMDPVLDLAKYYVAEINAGRKTINDVPANIKSKVEELLQ